MQPQGPSPAIYEDLKIAAGLGVLNHTESIFLSRDGEIVCVISRDLQEDTSVRPAFICLAGRMQEPRPEPETGGCLRSG